MGHLTSLFGGPRDSVYEGLQENLYFRRLDTDERTPILLTRLRSRGYDDSLLDFLIGEAVLVPERWNHVKAERMNDRQARRRALAQKLADLAQDVACDPDISHLTILDAMALTQAYRRTSDLCGQVEKGVLSNPLPDLTAEKTAWYPDDSSPNKHHNITIKGGPTQTDYPETTQSIGWEGKYPLPTLAEYLFGVAECLKLDEWPNRYDKTARQHVPRKKAATTAM